MKLSSIEITDKEYLIKLNKEDFDLSFINTLLKRIQTENFFSSLRTTSNDEMRGVDRERSPYFDHLDDK